MIPTLLSNDVQVTLLSVIKDFLFLVAQFVLPHHGLSRLIGYLAECRWPWLKNWLIQRFIAAYQVDMSEAAEPDPTQYACFNDFFVRALRPDARTPVVSNQLIACPADGAISQIGNIEAGRIFQAKGHSFSVEELLGGDQERAARFHGGHFATIYLSPKDYHRVHMPLGGELEQMTYVPGRLFSVNQLTSEQVPKLFARNERMVAHFSTEHGQMAMVMVGAMIVASIETAWAGLVTPPLRQLQQRHYPQQVALSQGEEMGRFKLGSTVILLFEPGAIEWNDDFRSNSPVRLGQRLGSAKSH